LHFRQRAAAIGLDRVQGVLGRNRIGSDPVEAKRIFADVQSRIKTNAPIYRRIRAMERNFK